MKLYTMEEVEDQVSGRLAARESKFWRGQEVLSGSWRRGGRRRGREREKVSPRGDKNQPPTDMHGISQGKKAHAVSLKRFCPYPAENRPDEKS